MPSRVEQRHPLAGVRIESHDGNRLCGRDVIARNQKREGGDAELGGQQCGGRMEGKAAAHDESSQGPSLKRKGLRNYTNLFQRRPMGSRNQF